MQYRKVQAIQKGILIFKNYPFSNGLSGQKFLEEFTFQTLLPSSGYASMEDYATIDQSQFPLIRIRFTGNKSTDENFQRYLDQTRNCYQAGKPLAIIFDATKATVPSFSHQKMQANWLNENKGLMQKFCLGTAYIIPNTVIRGILRVIFSLQKQPVPYKIFDLESEAEKWVKGLGI